MLKCIFTTFIGIISDVIKLVKVILIRVLNVFLKFTHKNTIEIDDENE